MQNTEKKDQVNQRLAIMMMLKESNYNQQMLERSWEKYVHIEDGRINKKCDAIYNNWS